MRKVGDDLSRPALVRPSHARPAPERARERGTLGSPSSRRRTVRWLRTRSARDGTCSNQRMMMPRGRDAVPLVLLVCVGLTACQSSGGGGGIDGPADAAEEAACQPVENEAMCVPIVECRACDAGLCGAVTNLAGCDFEDQVCVPDCGGPACMCLLGLWSCSAPAQGSPCETPGAMCPLLASFDGGTSTSTCTPCDGGPRWNGCTPADAGAAP
jgi:hypothetical protein